MTDGVRREEAGEEQASLERASCPPYSRSVCPALLDVLQIDVSCVQLILSRDPARNSLSFDH